MFFWESFCDHDHHEEWPTEDASPWANRALANAWSLKIDGLENKPRRALSSLVRWSTLERSRSFSSVSSSTFTRVSTNFCLVLKRLLRTAMLFRSRFWRYSSVCLSGIRLLLLCFLEVRDEGAFNCAEGNCFFCWLSLTIAGGLLYDMIVFCG